MSRFSCHPLPCLQAARARGHPRLGFAQAHAEPACPKPALGTSVLLKGGCSNVGCRAPTGGKQPIAWICSRSARCHPGAAALGLFLGCSVPVSGEKTSR